MIDNSCKGEEEDLGFPEYFLEYYIICLPKYGPIPASTHPCKKSYEKSQEKKSISYY